jgi:hypothetical protein
MKLSTILRKIVFFPLIVLAVINQILGIPIMLILVGVIVHKVLLFITIIALVITLDIIRHKWLIKNGYGMPVIGQYMNKKKIQEIEDKLDEHEEMIS